MKTLILLIPGLMITVFAFSQNNAQNDSKKSGTSETIAPIFAGNRNITADKQVDNRSVISNYLYNNINYPEEAISCCQQGTEVLRFTVLPSGNVANIKIVNSVCPKIDEEVIRVMSTTNGMWTPGSQNGLPVEMEKEILIVFHLDGFHLGTDNEYFTKKATSWYKRGNSALFEQKNPKKALKCFDNALRYKPHEDALLFARGMVKYELDDTEGARNDWNRMKSLIARGENESNLNLTVENFKDFSGYSNILNSYLHF